MSTTTETTDRIELTDEFTLEDLAAQALAEANETGLEVKRRFRVTRDRDCECSATLLAIPGMLLEQVIRYAESLLESGFCWSANAHLMPEQVQANLCRGVPDPAPVCSLYESRGRKVDMEDGNEVKFFRIAPDTYEGMGGREGYALLRGGRVIGQFVTAVF
jgi:hypothetical protein